MLLFNKPFGILCQFSGEEKNLSNYIDVKNFYPAGRLDKDSEGLLLLTDDGKLQHQISHPKFDKEKTYLVQVEGEVTNQAIIQLCQGITLKDGLTKPAKAKIVKQPDWLWDRNPPIRQRKNIPTSWIELKITEGKNRQVRRMSAAVGFPTLRLIRTQIGAWKLGDIQLGQYQYG
ncbi:ribosomal large subunit pseudouridine synthaseE [Bathymodiolus thermophilus thioautotrophic gill symbiont]|uniref:Pseudouridine synthase n=1 Tax=Bathymodiolus thermophilus thioautotrophic gill symbiont TaxID=2360 RepID=A0A3G3IMS4_9GAMM|nr:pseudouridine synthase [Bathymodiolus thermophilus thioautotrophic gill symbiont]AYQ57157.1 ribosomal large subunit pseudouridine synthaseE [Bathymodiolus thermophilus thioautotrophic gill symbiont]